MQSRRVIGVGYEVCLRGLGGVLFEAGADCCASSLIEANAPTEELR
jgi:hypothetical protein